jgi:hypothetical protein
MRALTLICSMIVSGSCLATDKTTLADEIRAANCHIPTVRA